jgi:hypothetical protein
MAAWTRRLASCASTFVRSIGVIPRSSVDSYAMLSCCVCVGSGRGFCFGLGKLAIRLLRNDAGIARGACSETVLKEKTAQFNQRAHRNPWCAKIHGCAGGSVQHPSGDDNDDAWFYLNVNNPSGCTLFAVLLSKAPSEKRVPTIVDFNFPPDMGRMTGRLLSAETTGCSPGRSAPANAPPPS